MTFLGAAQDLFLGRRSGHMGAFQYAAHAGRRGSQSMSGAFLWAQAEIARRAAPGTMVSAEIRLLRQALPDIASLVPAGTQLIELGPGTAFAFREKTLPLAQALDSRDCVLVEGSAAFLDHIAASAVKGLRLKPVNDDFFENSDAYAEGPALVCSFGGTIGNIVHPVSAAPPREALIQGLSALAGAAEQGWLLVAFDGDRDSARIRNYFNEHALFQLNIFDRMKAELPIAGDFDPCAFAYRPTWIPASGQLAHIAAVERAMDFTLNGTPIRLAHGQALHIKNSYKYDPAFFEQCCVEAGLPIMHGWRDQSTARIYLLKNPPRTFGPRPAPPAAKST